MITIIEGNEGEGKTSLANKISENRKVIYVAAEHIGSPFSFMSVQNHTEVIIVDDIKKKDFEKIYYCFRQDKITIERRGECSFKIKTPDVILIRF